MSDTAFYASLISQMSTWLSSSQKNNVFVWYNLWCFRICHLAYCTWSSLRWEEGRDYKERASPSSILQRDRVWLPFHCGMVIYNNDLRVSEKVKVLLPKLPNMVFSTFFHFGATLFKHGIPCLWSIDTCISRTGAARVPEPQEIIRPRLHCRGGHEASTFFIYLQAVLWTQESLFV